jgi:hypothetical protein
MLAINSINRKCTLITQPPFNNFSKKRKEMSKNIVNLTQNSIYQLLTSMFYKKGFNKLCKLKMRT